VKASIPRALFALDVTRGLAYAGQLPRIEGVTMEVLDRRTVGKGIGYTAAGAKKIGGPVVRPIADAGRDIVQEAREVASHDGARKTRSSREKSSSSS
jgi:hypothetical protein